MSVDRTTRMERGFKILHTCLSVTVWALVVSLIFVVGSYVTIGVLRLCGKW